MEPDVKDNSYQLTQQVSPKKNRNSSGGFAGADLSQNNKSHSLLATQHLSNANLALGVTKKGGKLRKNTTLNNVGDGTQASGLAWTGSMAQLFNIVQQEHDFFRILSQKTLNTKYLTSQEYYDSKIASDIMYNEQRHIVSVFKEYLIFDDFSEYLKRFYTNKEAVERLPRVFEFYDHYSKVFPNYVSVPESAYMFKNIERKQKLIDQRHQIFLKNQ